jgi:CAAX protease family protein
MSEPSPGRTRLSAVTWVGLFIALFGLLMLRQILAPFFPTLTFPAAIWKESLYWLCAIALLVIIRRGERLPLTSVGIGRSKITSSLLWAVVITLICLAIAVVVVRLTHFTGGATGQALARLPLWLTTAIVIRAGVVEELFYRGYAIERLQAAGLNEYCAAAIPLFTFSMGHWTGGWANIVLALALGAVLTGFYLWRRDLVANMIGHFLVDFIGNVLPRLFS